MQGNSFFIETVALAVSATSIRRSDKAQWLGLVERYTRRMKSYLFYILHASFETH
jgi:hypothetical protein